MIVTELSLFSLFDYFDNRINLLESLFTQFNIVGLLNTKTLGMSNPVFCLRLLKSYLLLRNSFWRDR